MPLTPRRPPEDDQLLPWRGSLRPSGQVCVGALIVLAVLVVIRATMTLGWWIV